MNDISSLDWRMRVKLVRQSGPLDAPILQQLAQDDAFQVRFWVARREDLDPTIVELLRRDEHEGVAGSLLVNSSIPLPGPEAELAAGLSVVSRRCLARRAGLSEETLAELAGDEDPIVRGFVAGNRGAVSPIIETLLDDDEWGVRAAAVVQIQNHPWVASRLAVDSDECVRAALADSPHCPSALLSQLATDDSSVVRATTARHRELDVVPATRLAGDGDVTVRRALAANGAITADVVAELAADSTPEVRIAVASRSGLAEPITDHLAGDPDERVRAALVQSTRADPMSDEFLMRMATDSSELVLDRLARRPGDLGRAFTVLVSAYPRAVIHRPDQPIDREQLLALAATDDPEVRKAVAGRHDLPFDVLENLSSDPSCAVRRAIAQRDDTPTTILTDLATDPERSVRRAAAQALDGRGNG